MIVTLDGRRLTHRFEAGATLGTVIDAVRGQQRDGRLLVSVAINGQPCQGAELDERQHRQLVPGDQIDFASEQRQVVCAQALRGIATGLHEAVQAQPRIADEIQAGHVAEGVRQVGDLLRIWHAVTNALAQCTELMGRDLTRVEFNDQPVGQYLDTLVDQLRQLRDALETRDVVLLGDLLHHDLPALCQTWHDLLMHVATVIETTATETDGGQTP